MHHKIVAAFDFDGTMTPHDTLLSFLFFAFGRGNSCLKLLRILPQLAGFPLGLKSRKEAKEIILTAFLKGLPLSLVEKQAALFAEGPLFKLIKPEAWQRYQWHRAQGHTSVLISANLSLYLAPWAKLAGFDHVLASEIEVTPDQILTGLLQGENCWGEEKVRRLTTLFGAKKGYLLYVYGDSRGDQALLKIADYPYYRTF
jgi:phosphatidylglycerophosphatase C